MHTSHVMTKPAFASAQSDQRLCFRCLDSIIPLLAIAEISRPKQACLSLTWSHIPETGFLATRLIFIFVHGLIGMCSLLHNQ